MTRAQLGEEIQTAVDRLQFRAARRPFGPLLLGIGLALSVIAGGLATFLIVLVFLVGVLR